MAVPLVGLCAIIYELGIKLHLQFKKVSFFFAKAIFKKIRFKNREFVKSEGTNEYFFVEKKALKLGLRFEQESLKENTI